MRESEDDWHRCALHFHAGGIHWIRGHLARPGDPAHAADVRIELRSRHRARGRDGRARRGAYAARTRDRIHRRGARGRQRRRRIRRDRADARDVQGKWREARWPRGTLMPAFVNADLLIQTTYLVTAALFILGLKRMSSPVTARSGILWAGAG